MANCTALWPIVTHAILPFIETKTAGLVKGQLKHNRKVNVHLICPLMATLRGAAHIILINFLSLTQVIKNHISLMLLKMCSAKNIL